MFFKKLAITLSALLVLGGVAMPAAAVFAATPTNLISNPLVETPDSSNSAMPSGWLQGNWGTNTTAFSYPTTGSTGDTRSVEVNMTSYTSGDAKWYFTPVNVSASTSYTFSDEYESNVATDVVAQLETSTGALSYVDLGAAPASSTWTQYSENFTTASNTTQVTIFHLIEAVGTLQTDNFSLTTTVPVTTTPPPTTGNLISNPSAGSTSTASTTVPSGWLQGNWGTNTTTFSYVPTGYSGNSALQVSTTKYTSGDAKWYFTPLTTLTAGKTYTFSDYYTSNVATDVQVQFESTSGAYSYVDLGSAAASSTYKQYTGQFTVPTGTANVTVFHLLGAVGTLTTSDFSLTANTTSTAPTVSITSPTATQTVTGTTNLVATATGATSVQFEVDGVKVGSALTTSPYTLSWNSTTVANGSHSVTAVATSSTGQTTTSSPVAITVSNSTTTTTNMIPNPMATTPDPNTPGQPLDWSPSGWGTNTATETDTTGGYNGSNSLNIDMTSYTSGDEKWIFPNLTPTPDVMYNFTDYYKSNVNTVVDAVFNLSNGTIDYEYIGLPSPATTWTKFSSSFVVPEGTTSMTIYHLIQGVGTLSTSDFSMTPYTPVGFSRSLVTLTFDDGYSSTYQYAEPLLDQYGYKSTQFIITDLLGQSGYMTDADLVAMNKDGQEIASHTVTHDDMTTETAATLTNELATSQSTLQSITGVKPTDIAYPYGDYDTTVQTATAKYYSGARGVEDGLNSKDNFNAMDLKVQNVYDTTTTAEVADWIKQAQATDTWLILVYHSVDLTSNTFDGTSEYNVTPTQLSEQLAAIKSSGITVETMKQALAETEAQL